MMLCRGAHGEIEAKGLASKLLDHTIDSAFVVNLQILSVRSCILLHVPLHMCIALMTTVAQLLSFVGFKPFTNCDRVLHICAE